MYKRHILGKIGEDIATKYLINKGYKIIERNFYCKMGEIDIIAKKDEYIVFIEVKTRSSNKYGIPVDAITNKKIKNLYKTAKFYVYTRRLQNRLIRFDAIEVYFDNGQFRVNHIKQIV